MSLLNGKPRTLVVASVFAILVAGIVFSPIPKVSLLTPLSAQDANVPEKYRAKINDAKKRYFDQLCRVAEHNEFKALHDPHVPSMEKLAAEKELIRAKIKRNLFLQEIQKEKKELQSELRTLYINLVSKTKIESEITDELYQRKLLPQDKWEEQKLILCAVELELLEKFPDAEIDKISPETAEKPASETPVALAPQPIKRAPLILDDSLEQPVKVLQNIPVTQKEHISPARRQLMLHYLKGTCLGAETAYRLEKGRMFSGALGTSASTYNKAIAKVIEAHLAKEGFIYEYLASEEEKQKSAQEYVKLLKLLCTVRQNRIDAIQGAYNAGVAMIDELLQAQSDLAKVQLRLVQNAPDLTKEEIENISDEKQNELQQWLDGIK